MHYAVGNFLSNRVFSGSVMKSMQSSLPRALAALTAGTVMISLAPDLTNQSSEYKFRKTSIEAWIFLSSTTTND